MGSDFGGGPNFKTDAKEYARFCRIHGLFMIDGLERWRTALRARGFSDEEIALKLGGAIDLVRRMADPASDQGTDSRVS